MNRLIAKAKSKPKSAVNKVVIYTDDEIELALEWFNGDITNTEYLYALGVEQKGSTSYVRPAQVLRSAIANGKVKKLKK